MASMTRTRWRSGEGNALQQGPPPGHPGVSQTVHGVSHSGAADAAYSASGTKKSVFDIFPKNFRPRSKSDAAGKVKRPKGSSSGGGGEGRGSGSQTPSGSGRHPGGGGGSRSPPATPTGGAGSGHHQGGSSSLATTSPYTTYHGGMFSGSQRSQKAPQLRDLFANSSLLAQNRSSRLSLHGYLERFELEPVADNQVFVNFMKDHRCHDVIPDGYNNKLIVFDTQLKVQKAFFALMEHNVRAAPLWDSAKQDFVGMLTISDFITILQKYYRSPLSSKNDIKSHVISTWRDVLKNHNERIAANKLVFIGPDATLYEAVKKLTEAKIHRLAVMDAWSGNVIQILTHKRLLRFLFQFNHKLPRPAFVFNSIQELGVGTYQNIVTVNPETPLINALNKFCKHRVSSLPVIDRETNKLVDIYAKYDTIKLASNQSYNNLDITVRQALQFGNVEGVGGPYTCKKEESLQKVMERIVRCNVHRLVIVDDSGHVEGIVSLSDVLRFIVLHQETLGEDGRPVVTANPNGKSELALTTTTTVTTTEKTTQPLPSLVSPKSPSPTKMRPALKLSMPAAAGSSSASQPSPRAGDVTGAAPFGGGVTTPPPALTGSTTTPGGVLRLEKTPSPLRETTMTSSSARRTSPAPADGVFKGKKTLSAPLRKKSIVDEIIPEFPSALELNPPELV